MWVFDTDRTAGAYESITVANASIGFTKRTMKPITGAFKDMFAKVVFCTLETNNIRFRIDGTAPTTSEGHLLSVGQLLTLKNAADIENFRAINAVVAASGILKVTFRF